MVLDGDGDDAVARTARPRLLLAGEPHLGAGLDPGGELEVDRLAVGQLDALHRMRRRVEDGNGEEIGDVGALIWGRGATPQTAAATTAARPETAAPPREGHRGT